jgi:hypothetical protein
MTGGYCLSSIIQECSKKKEEMESRKQWLRYQREISNTGGISVEELDGGRFHVLNN